MSSTLELQVTGEETIHCAGCETRIGNALRRLPGVQHVEASRETQKVRVEFDPTRIQPEAIRARVLQLGYEVSA